MATPEERATATAAAAAAGTCTVDIVTLDSDEGVIRREDGLQIGQIESQSFGIGYQPRPGITLLDSGSGPMIIPAENFVAAFRSEPGASAFGVATSASSARLILQALEIGLDGVLLVTQSASEVEELADFMIDSRTSDENIRLVAATVTAVTPTGMGDRACVDTAAMLHPGDGMLVGSFARGLVLVHCECLPHDFINSRPFRVNAGAVCSYALSTRNTTQYLSELCTGASVHIVSKNGVCRTELCGRVKIERRPLVRVDLNAEGTSFSVLLQHAETVMLIAEGGQPVSVCSLLPGACVLAHLPGVAARHAGIAIEETIVEL